MESALPETAKSPGFVTRFHLLELAVMAATTIVAWVKVAPDYQVVWLWAGSAPVLSMSREAGFLVIPVLAAIAAGFVALLGLATPPAQREMRRHVVEPALMWVLLALLAHQFGLLVTGLGSDIDITRIASFALGLGLLPVAVLVAEVERHSYAGLRMPWPIAGDGLFRLVHRLAGALFALGGVALIAAAWFWPDPGVLLLVTLAAMLLPVAAALLISLLGGGFSRPS